MKTAQNPQDFTPQEINQQMLKQQQWLLKTIDNQDSLLEELQAYLKMVEINIEDEMQEMKELMDKNSKCELNLTELNRQFERQQEEQLQFERKRSIEESKKQIAISTSREQLNTLKERKTRKQKELQQLQSQTLQIINHKKYMQNRLDHLATNNKKIQINTIKINNQTKIMNDFIEQCYMNKKKLNNELQQLRGNIRVYCRIRPFLPTEDNDPTYQLVNENTLKLKVPKENHKSQNHQKDYIFNFEQIFDMKQNQQNIFNELAQLIQSSVDGKNVCIFAYGQTGSGKTYTMQGLDTLHTKGIIPRSIELIFSEVEKARKYQWQSEISVTIHEVYLDNVKDLLVPKNSNEEILNKFQVKYPAEIYSLLQQAGKNRKVAQTSCNQHSSRSHLIFTIHILSKNIQKNLQRKGSLNLVDLAGSERIALSKVQGDRMKQTQSINKSLTHLGVVISALAKKQSHIPFRNSKLTFLLQKYLEGDSKTLMLVNISPKVNDFNQTMCSLRFAQKVKQCKIKK